VTPIFIKFDLFVWRVLEVEERSYLGRVSFVLLLQLYHLRQKLLLELVRRKVFQVNTHSRINPLLLLTLSQVPSAQHQSPLVLFFRCDKIALGFFTQINFSVTNAQLQGIPSGMVEHKAFKVESSQEVTIFIVLDILYAFQSLTEGTENLSKKMAFLFEPTKGLVVKPVDFTMVVNFGA
jgi:hypothetical protein